MSCMASSTQVALSLSAPMIIPMLLFGGFFLNNGSVPYYFDWLRYLSWFMYANEALSINQWQGVSFNDTTSTCPNFVCTGEAILKVFDFNPVKIFFNNYDLVKSSDALFVLTHLGLFLAGYLLSVCPHRRFPRTGLILVACESEENELALLVKLYLLVKKMFLCNPCIDLI